MNMAMLLQTAQTKYHHQVHLHDTEIIILAWDTILDPHLTIITGTDTGFTGQDHIPTVTDTEVKAKVIHREVTPGHITDVHTGAHLATVTQPLIIINGTHHTGDLHCTEALPHILEITVGLNHIHHIKLPIWHLLTLLQLYQDSLENKDKKYKQVTIDDPHPLLQLWWTIQWVRWGFKLREPSLSNACHELRGLPTAEIITVACITDCPTITVHTGKCYKALIDSWAAISLLRYSTYKKYWGLLQETHTTYYSQIKNSRWLSNVSNRNDWLTPENCWI